MKTIKGDLILEKNTEFDGDLEVEGDIRGKDRARYDLKVNGNIVAGNIDALDITAWNITAWNITAGNIDAGNIVARDIVAGNIDASVIICQTIKLKDKTKGKIKARAVIRNRLNLEQKGFESD